MSTLMKGDNHKKLSKYYNLMHNYLNCTFFVDMKQWNDHFPLHILNTAF